MGLEGKQSCLDTLGRTGKPSYATFVCCMPIGLAIFLLDTVSIACVLLRVVFLFHDLPWPLNRFFLGVTPPPPGLEPGTVLGNNFEEIAGVARAINVLFSVAYITAAICSTSAVIGAAKQPNLVRLARTSYYVRLFFFVMWIFLDLPMLCIVATLAFQSDRAGAVTDFFVGVLRELIGFGAAYYTVQINRSLFHILEAGGSGWECMSAEEIKLEKQLDDVEQLTTPLFDGRNPHMYQ